VTNTLAVGNGGTGATSFTANLPIIGNGTSALTQGTVSGLRVQPSRHRECRLCLIEACHKQTGGEQISFNGKHGQNSSHNQLVHITNIATPQIQLVIVIGISDPPLGQDSVVILIFQPRIFNPHRRNEPGRQRSNSDVCGVFRLCHIISMKYR
jgi:hypothetical protein